MNTRTLVARKDEPALDETAAARRFDPRALLAAYPMIPVLVLLVIGTTIAYPGFWSSTNLTNMLMQNAPLALASIGMTFVILAGGFDLSVGAVYATAAVFYISMDGRLPATAAVVVSVLVGLVCGVVNAVLVNVFEINPFVATLGSGSAITGLMTLYAGASANFAASESYGYIGSRIWHGIPISVAITALLFIAAGFLLAKTTFGRGIYAVGGSIEAARLSGLRVRLIGASTFIMIGGLAALGGVIAASQVGTAQPNFGTTLALDAIAVVIIGGTSLVGGEGAIWRSAVGLGILVVVNNLFSSLTLDPALQAVIKGLIVIIAVGADVWARKRAAR